MTSEIFEFVMDLILAACLTTLIFNLIFGE